MYAKVLPYLSMPWLSILIDLFSINCLTNSVASWLNGIDFSGVLIPMSLSFCPLVSSNVSPSMTLATIMLGVIVISSVNW